MGKYFEELNAGDLFTTPGRTVTEADVAMFAGLTGDYNLIHTDHEYAAATHFGQRVAHGLLTLSILTGLMTRTGLLEGTVIALRRLRDVEFKHPVFFGDTIHGDIKVAEKEEKRGMGLVRFDAKATNQRGEVVLKLTYDVLLQLRPIA